MIAALLQLHYSLAPEASLPSLVLGLSQESYRFLVLRTIPCTMPLPITPYTDLGLTPRAPAVLPPVLGMVDILGADELVAAALDAVDTILGGVLDELLVPCLFELIVKQFVHVFQGDVVCGAAPGRHVLGVRDRQLEASLEA